jgi:predicted DNA-binding transcriptional regulator AlpA
MMGKYQTAADIEMVLRHNIDPFVRIQFVIAATGLSRSTIYRLIAQRKFPLPCHPTQFTTAWRLSAVRDWISERERSAACRIRIS